MEPLIVVLEDYWCREVQIVGEGLEQLEVGIEERPSEDVAVD
jgi:hypothetical protein